MANSEDAKRLAASITQFLRNEVEREGVTPDMQESIDVARQCLEMAYATDADDVPSQQPTLIDMFVKNCPTPPPIKELTPEDKALAEKFKQEGNDCMRGEKYEEAITAYNKAIEIHPRNSVYYCNRAAAQTGRQSYDLALRDCKKALDFDPKYSKAYSRMGLTYSKMEIYDEAIKCYEKALELDPNNEGYKKNMEIAQEKQSAQQTSMAGGGLPGGLPAGLPGGLGGFLNNPAFMNMAKQVMENPAMQQMAMSMMGGAANVGEMADELRNRPPAASGEAPDLSNILQMGQHFAQQLSQENPELVEQIRQQVQNTDTSSLISGKDKPEG